METLSKKAKGTKRKGDQKEEKKDESNKKLKTEKDDKELEFYGVPYSRIKDVMSEKTKKNGEHVIFKCNLSNFRIGKKQRPPHYWHYITKHKSDVPEGYVLKKKCQEIGCVEHFFLFNDKINSVTQMNEETYNYYLEKFQKNTKKDTKSDCIFWTGGKTTKGYGKLGFFESDRLAHRFSWELHHRKDVPVGLFICHSCDNPICINPLHLRPDTHQGNMDDRKKRGRVQRGEKHAHHKYTEKNIRKAIDMRRQKKQLSEIFEKTGIPSQTIQKIEQRESWTHIDLDLSYYKKAKPTLTPHQVREVRRSISTNKTQEERSKMFGITRRTVGRIDARQLHANVPDNSDED